ncbi:MAG: hypothetical protein K9L61_01995 [Candidatus Omnitrophica bacterium]|nr:hypothetical protein [Candidatus Omnitrophota bacterium]
MKNNVWIISLLVGLVVILVIGGVSLLVKINSLSKEYKQESARNISLEKTIEDLKAEIEEKEEAKQQLNAQNISLSNTVDQLKKENVKLTLEIEQLKEKIKKLEEKEKSSEETSKGQ